jgi:hypothetical protein
MKSLIKLSAVVSVPHFPTAVKNLFFFFPCLLSALLPVFLPCNWKGVGEEVKHRKMLICPFHWDYEDGRKL